MALNKYMLVDKTPVPCLDLLEWFENFDNSVAKTQVGNILVSTVFLGIDHRFGEGRPLLFETMTFDGGDFEEADRCSTWDEAMAQHERIVKLAKQHLGIE